MRSLPSQKASAAVLQDVPILLGSDAHALSLHPFGQNSSEVLPEFKSHLSRVLLSLQVSFWHFSSVF